MIRAGSILLWLLVFLGTEQAFAHEVRPAYLELVQSGPETIDVTWKQPVLGDKRLKLDPVFPEDCQATEHTAERIAGALVERWQIGCTLSAGTVSIAGLDRTLTDVFFRLQTLDGNTVSVVLRPGSSSVDLTEPLQAAVPAYLRIGVDHILYGFDHLLFVIGIVLLVRREQMFATITAFTVAHSLTLALASLGGVSLPGPPVEIAIALSISLLGVEAIYRMRGRPSFGARWPWIVAFSFGLIHGFGFAGALAEIGLPKGTEALALLLFNLGVELGQVMVLAALLVAGWLVSRLGERPLAGARYASACFIGIAGMFWAIERVAATFFV